MKNTTPILAITASLSFIGYSLGFAQITNANPREVNSGEQSLRLLAQSSPWGQVESPQTYTNPDTGQVLCFYSSGRWAPCPGQGNTIIIPPNAKCRGQRASGFETNSCPINLCSMENLHFPQPGEQRPPSLPCTGLP
ncbi:hypothetical protein ACE1CI_31085 [Aerosakkonemataceae cyanobacterium BLCC-F50]|uniref:Secreted protein n=1 Tax=Floridaenema flaviceps BLCC-F50 TaxID=3153642 RepID=A0ABV4Y065_9CYAN